MGAFLTMEGLLDAQKTGTLGRRAQINNIVLASPDIDIDLFSSQISVLPKAIRERMYVPVSRDDRALFASRRIAGGVPRVGDANPESLERFGVTVIDLSDISDSSSGSHFKFAASPGVVQIIGAGLNNADGFVSSDMPGLKQLLTDVPIRILGG